MTSPIFFDASGRRRVWSARAVAVLVLLVALAAVGFAATVAAVPTPRALPLKTERLQPLPFRTQLANLGHRLGRLARPPLAGVTTGQPLVIGFYVPWDDTSRLSLQRHMGELDWVVPALAQVSGPDHTLTVQDDPKLDRLLAQSPRRPRTVLLVQNFEAGRWNGAGIADLLAHPAAADRVLAQVAAAVAGRHDAGVMFDFEELPAQAQPAYCAFLGRAKRALGGAEVAVAAPADDPDWHLDRLARSVDHVILMNYDEHADGGPPGPIASQVFFESRLAAARAAVPPAKLIVAIASYAYDWHGGGTDPLTVAEAWLAAHDSGVVPRWDPASGNSGFAYEEDGEAHTVWMVDAAAVANQLRAVGGTVAGVALWRLGSEDPGVWPDLAGWRGGGAPALDTLPVPLGNDVVGTGELLRIVAQPTTGRRAVRFSPAGAITDEVYRTLPTPYVVRRYGAARREIALTFDDGPDPDWTPRILDVLKATATPATFFVIGENALQHPLLLRRIYDEGHAVGNHTYTHPNLAQESVLGTELELNANQRMIEAYTGHSTRLFRAPYFGDAEPTTADELVPATLAQDRGYTIVGLHVDPNDWQRPGVDAIVRETLGQIAHPKAGESADIVLLHDGGGDRAQTVAALPRIIAALRANGYRIVPLSTLAGVTPAALMPAVTGADLFAVRSDVGLFLVLAGLAFALKWLFFLAIGLGIARAVLLTGLALLDRRVAPPPIAADHLVSVIIPAFNEERVIVASVERVLASRNVTLQVIVVDDGSTDSTSRLVSERFGDDGRVRLLTLPNGGKAAALNRALALAAGEIVIALDADTQFEAETVARLARWFADERVGAVAGNAKVGNRRNLATRWQAIEYTTAQNVERRALDALGAITVVPVPWARGGGARWTRSAAIRRTRWPRTRT